LNGAETWTLRKVNQKYLGSFDMFWNLILEKAGEVQLDHSCEKWRSIANSQGGKEHHTYNKRREGHILRRNCLLKHVIEGKIERQEDGRRRKQLLDDLKVRRGYWKLKEEALDRSLWRTRFGRGYGHIARQTTWWWWWWWFHCYYT
jgi:hypothetical protein